MSRDELEKLGFTFKDPKPKMSYEELESRYKKIKNYLFHQGIILPIDVDPYTHDEYNSRINIPELYWTSRDYEAIEAERMGKCDWIKDNN